MGAAIIKSPVPDRVKPSHTVLSMDRQSFTPHPTQSRSLRRQSSQPITWLILTNKTIQEKTWAKYKVRKYKQKQNTAKANYSGSVTSYDTRPGNEIGLFYTHGPSALKFWKNIWFDRISWCIFRGRQPYIRLDLDSSFRDLCFHRVGTQLQKVGEFKSGQGKKQKSGEKW